MRESRDEISVIPRPRAHVHCWLSKRSSRFYADKQSAGPCSGTCLTRSRSRVSPPAEKESGHMWLPRCTEMHRDEEKNVLAKKIKIINEKRRTGRTKISTLPPRQRRKTIKVKPTQKKDKHNQMQHTHTKDAGATNGTYTQTHKVDGKWNPKAKSQYERH